MKQHCKLLPFLIFFFGIFIYNSEVKAQNNPNEQSFHEKLAESQLYWDSQIEQYGSEEALLDINNKYKHYLRFKNYYKNRINPGETIEKYEVIMQTFFENEPESYNESEWTEVGPNMSGYVGPINFITIDPNDATNSRMFAGGEHGGLFFSEDGGEHWVNAGTDDLSHSISSADAQFSPIPGDTDTWFFYGW